MTDLHSVHTMVDEGSAFVEQHCQGMNETQRTWGALPWGLLRALYECPNCPGHFRRPRKATYDGGVHIIEVLWCPNCEGQWVHRDDLAELEKNEDQPVLPGL